MLSYNLFKTDYDAINKDLLKNNIRFFKPIDNSKLCNLLDDGKYQQIEELLKIKDSCYDYEIHANYFFVIYFKDAKNCKSYISPELIEIPYQEYEQDIPSNYTIRGKSHVMGKRFFELIVEKHRTLF